MERGFFCEYSTINPKQGSVKQTINYTKLP